MPETEQANQLVTSTVAVTSTGTTASQGFVQDMAALHAEDELLLNSTGPLKSAATDGVGAAEAAEAVKPHVPPVSLISHPELPPDVFTHGMPVVLNTRVTELPDA